MRWFSKKTSQVFTSTQQAMSRVVGILKGKKQLSQEELLQLRNALIDADVGLSITEAAMAHIKAVCAQGMSDEHTLIDALKDYLVGLFQEGSIQMDEGLNVVLVVGVNGVGKTTTIAKLAKHYISQGLTVAMASGDTYRAAADEQLTHWSDTVGAMMIPRPNTQDPAAVMYDAYQVAKENKVNILLADTAGRMHSNQGLLDQLQKVKRVLQKLDPAAPQKVWLVLDGSLGQSNFEQARIFHETLNVDGVIVTKVDGSAKGGAVFSVAQEGLPVLFVGSGEGAEDIAVFEPASFVEVMMNG
ncbi:MAG: signal recognition particle-docking protein FtsY [Pseudomonadota bacterium]|nr:signal recognition particle-docking protein FtsY [Pseudomonadota bacterium]